YGDLDVSVIKELPPRRGSVTTVWAQGPIAEASAWAHVLEEVEQGRQAYVVCPRISSTDKPGPDSPTWLDPEAEDLPPAAAVEEVFARLTAGPLAGLKVEMLHGQLPAEEKDAVMGRYAAGQTDVLVATTVIEVGVDVPNATVMVVLDADRFGIAQLHQLRGRVGRGSHRSTCYLVAAGSTEEAEARLEALVRTTDGFELAEVDLDLRGEGTLMGERQKGRSDLKLASLRRDREWVAKARDVAIALVDGDPDLSAHPLLADEVALFLGEDEQDFLLKG
ncbi:MAG TPA: helicase-related protein, partial [Acidimicrobiales bacterium]|nr:helicase-related protein [Acidimicrobiales bacterium]